MTRFAFLNIVYFVCFSCNLSENVFLIFFDLMLLIFFFSYKSAAPKLEQSILSMLQFWGIYLFCFFVVFFKWFVSIGCNCMEYIELCYIHNQQGLNLMSSGSNRVFTSFVPPMHDSGGKGCLTETNYHYWETWQA